MADNIYTVTPVSVEGISQYERYSAEDTNLIDSFEINTAFDSKKNISELHIYTVGNTLLRSITNYDRYKIELGSGASAEGSTSLTLDPEKDAIYYGYESGGVKLLYLFLNNLFSDLKQGLKLYVKEISNDRTELKLSSTGISNEDLKKYALELKGRIEDTSFFSEFRLNFGNNDLFIGVNIDYNDDEDVVTIKLYEPLPNVFTIKSTLDIVEFISNPLAYEIEAEFTPDAPRVPRLREANFNLELDDNTATPSQYFSFDELFSYNIENTNYQVLSLFNEKGAEISIDHTDYSDFIHFSSAEERLINFKYKLDLIKNYESSISNISNDLGTSGVTNNKEYYQKLLKGVVDNFDHYERYLYFESGSYAWPKSNENKPYINQASTTSEAITWFANQRTAANNYDVSNFNALTNTIPAFIREDENNAPYTLFVHMLGQHFDNLYIYAKAVSDKYDADNRVNIGVSRDLVEDAIKSLGVKLYNSSKSLEDLFKYFVGEFQLDTGEVINTDIKAGRVLSGGRTVEGLDNNFTLTSKNPRIVSDQYQQGTGTNFTRLGYNTTKFVFASNVLEEEYDENEIFSYLGGTVYITLIDTDSNTTLFDNAPYRRTDSPRSKLDEGTVYIKAGSNFIYILHFKDAEGTDHSAAFNSVNRRTNDLTLIIKTSRVVSQPVVQTNYQPTSEDIYQKSIYKRIYHNLPFLLKTKGTQRGLRALINCFGIPANVLKIKTYGGRDTSERPFLGDGQSHTVSNQKIRTDNTGSIVEGDTLSAYTSIVKTDDSYNQDLHNVEVGFSPSDSLDSLIQSTLGDSFSIDDYIGDPRDLTLDNYSDLLQATKTALADVTERYDIKDFVRLIKFFDNVVFKMIKDFVPARSTTDTGIIIKPHLLDRSKAKSISASATQPEYSGSIDTAFITGSNPGTYKSSASGSLRFDSESSKFRAKTLQGIPGESSTRHVGIYRKRINTPERINTFKQYKTYTDHGQEESKYDGELKNSQIVLSTGELNDENNLKQIKYPFIGFDVFLYKNPPVNICLLDSDSSESVIISIKEFTKDYIINIDPDIFPTVSPTTEYYEDLSFDENGDPINLNDAAEYGDQIVVSKDPNSTEFPQYTPFPIVAYDDSFDDCNLEKTFQIVRCKLKEISSAIPTNPSIAEEYDLTSWYSGLDTNYNYNILVNGEVIENTTSYRFSAGNNIVKIQDSIDPENCFIERSYNVNSCPITVQTPYIVNDFVSYYPVVDFFGKKGNLDIQYLIRFEKEDGSTYSSEFLNDRITENTKVFNNDGYLKIPTGDENYLVSDRGDLLTLFFSGNEDDFQEFFQIKFKAFNTEECQPVTSATFLQLEARVPTAVVYKATAILDLNVCFACQYGKDPYSPTVDLYFIETEYLRPAENTYEVKNGNLDDAVGKQVWKTEEAARDKSTERTDQSSPGYYREGTDNPFLVSDGILEYFGSEGCADAQALCNIRISK